MLALHPKQKPHLLGQSSEAVALADDDQAARVADRLPSADERPRAYAAKVADSAKTLFGKRELRQAMQVWRLAVLDLTQPLDTMAKATCPRWRWHALRAADMCACHLMHRFHPCVAACLGRHYAPGVTFDTRGAQRGQLRTCKVADLPGVITCGVHCAYTGARQQGALCTRRQMSTSEHHRVLVAEPLHGFVQACWQTQARLMLLLALGAWRGCAKYRTCAVTARQLQHCAHPRDAAMLRVKPRARLISREHDAHLLTTVVRLASYSYTGAHMSLRCLQSALTYMYLCGMQVTMSAASLG